MKLNHKTIRAQRYDYRSTGAYFITICTKNRVHYFGEVLEGHMVLNELGCQTWNCWNQIPKFHPHVIIDEFVCMPNHIHGIILIHGSNHGFIDKPVEFIDRPVGIIVDMPVGTHYMRPYNDILKKDGCNPSLQCLPESLGSIVRGFKIGVTKFALQNNIQFSWQSRFHDHIIRDQSSYERIKWYIKKNPSCWKEDVFK